MHIATILKPVLFNGQTLEPGKYALEDHNAGHVLWAGGGFGEVQLSPGDATFDMALPVSGRILVVRVGGFGDLLWLNSLYERFPADIEIDHACFPRYAPVLQGFANAVSYPVPLEEWCNYDAVYWLENLIERRPCVDGEHPCDRMAEVFGLDPTEKKAAYQITIEEAAHAAARWPRTDRKRVAIQMESSGNLKSYHAISATMTMLWGKDHEILVVGEPRPDAEKIPFRVYDCTQKQHSIRESIAMLANCDVLVASDSVMIHAAHALDIPSVGLFGPFDAATYMSGYSGIPIQGHKKCSPCHHHGRGSYFPVGGPCEKSGYCTALAQRSPEFVALMVERLLNTEESGK